jgi:hypothetical protein
VIIIGLNPQFGRLLFKGLQHRARPIQRIRCGVERIGSLGRLAAHGNPFHEKALLINFRCAIPTIWVAGIAIKRAVKQPLLRH